MNLYHSKWYIRMHPGSEAILDTVEDSNYQNEEAVKDGHLSQSKFKRPPVKSFLTVGRKHWHIKATAGACIDIISSPHILLCTNRFICGGPFCKWDLFTCLFEMISLMFTGVWNHPWYINEMIKAAGLPCSGSWTAASEHSGASAMRPNFNTHRVLISWRLHTAFSLWVCIKTQSFQSEDAAACSQTTD